VPIESLSVGQIEMRLSEIASKLLEVLNIGQCAPVPLVPEKEENPDLLTTPVARTGRGAGS
jgi:hypothetical protein